MYLIADRIRDNSFLPSSPIPGISVEHYRPRTYHSSTQGSNIAAAGAKGSRGDHKILVQSWSNKSGKGSVEIGLILGRGSIRRKNCHRLSMRVGKLGGEYSDFLGYQSTQSGV